MVSSLSRSMNQIPVARTPTLTFSPPLFVWLFTKGGVERTDDYRACQVASLDNYCAWCDNLFPCKLITRDADLKPVQMSRNRGCRKLKEQAVHAGLAGRSALSYLFRSWLCLSGFVLMLFRRYVGCCLSNPCLIRFTSCLRGGWIVACVRSVHTNLWAGNSLRHFDLS